MKQPINKTVAWCHRCEKSTLKTEWTGLKYIEVVTIRIAEFHEVFFEHRECECGNTLLRDVTLCR